MSGTIAQTIGAAGFVLLTACSSGEVFPPENALATDAVRDEATAIRIGQEECLAAWALPRARTEPGWQATLHNRIWHVGLVGKACESFSSDLDAATGKRIGECSICVA